MTQAGWVACVDFGTTNTVVAAWCNGVVRMVKFDHQQESFPSAVFLQADGVTWLTGQQALNAARSDDSGFLRTPKSMLNARSLRLQGRDVPVEEAVAAVFRTALQALDREFGPAAPAHLVVTYPATWKQAGTSRSQALLAAVQRALGDLALRWPAPQLVLEPVAAAFSGSAAHQLDHPGWFAVLDIGGGTSDVAVLDRRDDGTIHEYGADGGLAIGGELFDQSIARALMVSAGQEGLYLEWVGSADPAQHLLFEDLLITARGEKEIFTERAGDIIATIVVSYNPRTTVDGRVPQELVREIFRGGPDRRGLSDAIGLLDKVLRATPRSEADFHGVLAVGGSSRIPELEVLLAQSGWQMLRVTDPTTVVADGAVRQASRLLTGRGRPDRSLSRRGALVMGAAAAAVLTIGVVSWQHGWLFPPVPPPSPAPTSSAAAQTSPCTGSPSGDPLTATFIVDGKCYGLTDGATGGGGLGTPATRDIQGKIFERNAEDLKRGPLTADDLTVIWFGQPSSADALAQVQQLEGLQLAQARPGQQVRVHVVVGDAGPKMANAETLAKLIINLRRSTSIISRLVVVGGGDSRSWTKRAISALVDAGVPFVAPTLTADLLDPGKPFVNKPGYFQLSPPNLTLARADVQFIAQHTPPGSKRRIVVYTPDDANDEYTQSFKVDTGIAVREQGERVEFDDKRDVVHNADDLPVSICQNSGGRLGSAVVFAARNDDFKKFAEKVTSLCKNFGGRPALIIADDSVTRFMTDDYARADIPLATWPMAYNLKGAQCATLGKQSPGSSGDQLLRGAKNLLTPARCTAEGKQLGESVSGVWDAVILAEGILSAAQRGAGPVLSNLSPQSFTTAGGTLLDVTSGRVTGERAQNSPDPAPVLVYCVPSVGASSPEKASGRGTGVCDQPGVFGPTRRL